MKSFATLAMAAGAYASCSTFSLTASGGESGTIGHLADGQVRIGGGLPQTCYSICANGTVRDSTGYGCYITRKFFSLHWTSSILTVRSWGQSIPMWPQQGSHPRILYHEQWNFRILRRLSLLCLPSIRYWMEHLYYSRRWSSQVCWD